jgi:hypothetical protein
MLASSRNKDMTCSSGDAKLHLIVQVKIYGNMT